MLSQKEKATAQIGGSISGFGLDKQKPPDWVARFSRKLYCGPSAVNQKACSSNTSQGPRAKSQEPVYAPTYICTHSCPLATRFLKEIFMLPPGTSIRTISTSARA